MLETFDLRLNPHLLPAAVARAGTDSAAQLAAVRDILAAVRRTGDAALVELTSRFDGVSLAPGGIRVGAEELAEAWASLDDQLRSALERAAERIRAYHRRDESAPHRYEADGVVVAERELPVDRAGIYVPGGRADYPSTLLMTAIPAQAAGVGEIALCVPPRPDGSLPASVAGAAHMLGIGEVYRVGGAQAIGAMAYGTESIRSVDVICGPGNAYVALAKAEVARDVGVESLAGPSECVVLADAGAPVDAVAADLMAQAEHGPGGFAMLVTWSDEVARSVLASLERFVRDSGRREEIISTFSAGGRLVLCSDADQAVAVANAAAAEHLQLMVADPDALLSGVRHAGAVFCGYDTPVTLGDYVAGPSHVLPTAGTARFASALRPADFRKSMHVVSASRAGLAEIGPVAATIARAEGLPSHALTIDVRLENR